MSMQQRLFQTLCVCGLYLLASCAHQPDDTDKVVGVLKGQTQTTAIAGSNSDLSREHLNKEQLNKDVLQKLLVTHFAYADQDWALAVSSSVDAAKLSNDWRIYEKPARAALMLKDYEGALRLSTLWMEKEPSSEVASLIFVASQIGLGHVQQASKVADKFAFKNTQTNYDVLSQYLRIQSNAAAVTLMQELHAKHYKSPSFLFNAALIAIWFRQIVEAEKWLSEALELSPNYEPALLLQYELLKANKGLPTALDYLYVHAKRHESAYAVRNKLLSEWYELGRYQLVLDFSKSIDLKNPNHVEIGSYLAQSYVQLENYSAAKAVLKDMLATSPGYEQAKFRLGWLSFYSKDYEAAIKWFSQVSVNAEFHFESNMKIAQSLASQVPGEVGMQRALRQLNSVDSLTRKQFIRHAEVRDDILQENKQYLRAFAFANDALINYPNATGLLYRRAMSAIYVDEIATAEADLKKVLRYQPNNATVLNTLGYILVENTDRYDEARLYIEKALELEPNSYHILDSMGWLLFKLGDLVQAQTFLEKAYAVERHPEVSAHLAEVLFLQGNVELAKKILNRATQEHDNNEIIMGALKRLGLKKS